MSFREQVIHIFEVLRCLLFGYCAYTPGRAKEMFTQASGMVFDAIIVPGAPFDGDRWGEIMRARVCWSYFLYSSGRTRYVIYSGGAVHSPWCEAKVMQLYGIALGIPPEHILLELRAEHSRENVYYGFCLAKKAGLKRIALATDPSQAKMLEGFVRREVDPALVLLPIVAEEIQKLDVNEPVIDAQQAYVADFVPLRKRQSLPERIRGMFGKRLKNCDPV